MFFNSVCNPVESNLSAPGFAINKRSDEVGRQALCSLKNSLKRRLILFLFTAEPTFLLVVIPRRCLFMLFRQIKTLKCSVLLFLPALKIFLYSKDLRTFSPLVRVCFFMVSSRKKGQAGESAHV